MLFGDLDIGGLGRRRGLSADRLGQLFQRTTVAGLLERRDRRGALDELLRHGQVVRDVVMLGQEFVNRQVDLDVNVNLDRFRSRLNGNGLQDLFGLVGPTAVAKQPKAALDAETSARLWKVAEGLTGVSLPSILPK